MLNRRDFLRRGVCAGGALLSAPMINRGRFQLRAGEREYSRRTLDLVRDSLVIDMLGLLTLDWDKFHRWCDQPGSFRASDFHKLKRSGITVFHPAADLNAGDNAFTATREWLRDWNVFLGNYPQELMRVDGAADITRVREAGRVGVILGMQNADHFRTPEDVEFFYRLGQRVSQLTYNAPNQVGTGCTSPHDTGLTAFGAQVVAEMNRVGMAVDVSHSSDCTSRDAIEASRKPVLITHSNCRALVPRHPRCKPDDVIRRMGARGGVIGITGVRRFVSNVEPTTLENVLDHFDYVAHLAGVEHVGIGSDNDLDGRDRRGAGIRMDISGLADPMRVFELTEGLVRRRYSDRSIRLILGGNFQRALKDIWGA